MFHLLKTFPFYIGVASKSDKYVSAIAAAFGPTFVFTLNVSAYSAESYTVSSPVRFCHPIVRGKLAYCKS